MNKNQVLLILVVATQVAAGLACYQIGYKSGLNMNLWSPAVTVKVVTLAVGVPWVVAVWHRSKRSFWLLLVGVFGSISCASFESIGFRQGAANSLAKWEQSVGEVPLTLFSRAENTSDPYPRDREEITEWRWLIAHAAKANIPNVILRNWRIHNGAYFWYFEGPPGREIMVRKSPADWMLENRSVVLDHKVFILANGWIVLRHRTWIDHLALLAEI
jgi:hypothetical protein